jgi:hypothetical protein
MNEKARQVACMAQIYRGAKRTLIYLGDEQKSVVKAAFEFVDEINTRIIEMCKRDDGPWALFPYIEPEDPILNDARWKFISILFSSVWFKRGWTVQEAALAQESLVIWGQYEIDWANVMRTDVWANWRAPHCALTHQVSAPALHWHNYFGRHQHEARFFWEDKNPPIMGLLTILESARSLGVTDPRDRLYAFLGLFASNEGDDPMTYLKLQPSYEHSFLDVYKDFAIRYIESKWDVELLDYVQHTQQTMATELPSWIPRWDIKLSCGSRLYIPLWQSLTDRISSIHRTSMIGHKLRVRTVILDSIIYVSETLSPSGVMPDNIANLWKTIVQIDVPSPYPPLYRLHALIETLYGDILQGDPKAFRTSQAAYLLEIHRKSKEAEGIDFQYWREIAEGGDWDLFYTIIQWRLWGKRIFLTERGYLGAVYEIGRIGDRCGIIFGCKSPSVLRKIGAGNGYRLLGGAYITGAKPQADQENFQRFTLLGREESKDWTDWDVREEYIVLC